jgi:hypothetical protein
MKNNIPACSLKFLYFFLNPFSEAPFNPVSVKRILLFSDNADILNALEYAIGYKPLLPRA